MATMCRKIIVQTGNIIDMEDQIRLVGQSTSEELKGCVKTALSQWVPSPHEDRDTVVVRGTRKPLLYSGMRGVSTTVKIFLSENSSDYVRDAIETVLNNVDRDVIDCVIVAPPDVSDDVSLSDVMETWRALEVAVSEGLVRHVGIADASNRLFKELYDWAQVKPSTIQINLSNCCDVSEEMRVFARAHDVQILTHSDDADMLDEDVVTSILSCVGAPQVPCSVQWLARHRTIQTCFGLILDKGYTIAIDCTEGGD